MSDAARRPASDRAADTPMDDRPLLEQLRAGNQAALAALHERHAHAVYLVARAALGTPDDAEEATQDAFVLLWRKSRQVEVAGTSVLPWLLITVRFLAANIVRARRRQARHVAEFPRDVTDPGLMEELAITAEQVKRVEALIAELPKADQDVYRLCLIEGLSYKQAAYQLRVTHSSVRNRLSRVRATLRKEIDR